MKTLLTLGNMDMSLSMIIGPCVFSCLFVVINFEPGYSIVLLSTFRLARSWTKSFGTTRAYLTKSSYGYQKDKASTDEKFSSPFLILTYPSIQLTGIFGLYWLNGSFKAGKVKRICLNFS